MEERVMSATIKKLTCSGPTQANFQIGVTLVELVISMVIIGVVVIGIFGALSGMAGSSGDPVPRTQAIAIAEAYLEEVRLQQYESVASCPVVPVPGGRAQYIYSCHYQGLSDSGARDQFGNVIVGLEDYQVVISVSQTSALGGIIAADAQRLEIRVTSPAAESFTLSTYKTRAWP